MYTYIPPGLREILEAPWTWEMPRGPSSLGIMHSAWGQSLTKLPPPSISSGNWVLSDKWVTSSPQPNLFKHPFCYKQLQDVGGLCSASQQCTWPQDHVHDLKTNWLGLWHIIYTLTLWNYCYYYKVKIRTWFPISGYTSIWPVSGDSLLSAPHHIPACLPGWSTGQRPLRLPLLRS